MTEKGTESLSEVPEAIAQPGRKRHLSLVWLVPLVAVLAGGWLAVRAIIEQGPTITIAFNTAEGLEAGKTKIKLNEVEIGLVEAITLDKNFTGVVVTATLSKQAEPLLVEDTRFWVVRPRVTSSSVSGLGTLLSGAYIGVDVGELVESRRDFIGLEEPPVLTGTLPGRSYVLKATDLGSINYGTPVYFRRIQVGEVTAYKLDQDGQGVTATIFVHAPYDRYVTTDTRFWNASGIDIALDATGIRVQTESVAAIVAGGIAFGQPPEGVTAEAAPPKHEFSVYAGRTEALRAPDTRVEHYAFLFGESVRGLAIGAPVDFRGIVVGEVSDITVQIPDDEQQVDMRVEVRLFLDRLRTRARIVRGGLDEPGTDAWRAAWQKLVAAGLRGQLRIGNLLTGQRYIAVDYFPKAPPAEIDWTRSPPELPTTTGGLAGLQDSAASIAGKLERLPYEELAAEADSALKSLNSVLQNVDRLVRRVDTDITPELRETLIQARKSLAAAEQTVVSAERTIARDSPLTSDTRNALREVARTAQSLRALVEYLERHPEALLRGK
jgi:paraquat-inducible protein B